jgi:hypothetical protein
MKTKKRIVSQDPKECIKHGQKVTAFSRSVARTAVPVVNEVGEPTWQAGERVINYTNNPPEKLFSARMNSSEFRKYRRTHKVA